MNKKGNIQQNKLSLKALQAQLNDIQNNKNTKPVSDVKVGGSIQNFKQYLSSSFGLFYLFSWVLYFINKIPLLKYLMPILEKVIGKTSVWALLTIFRKAFISFNALIGLYLVIKTTGFSYTNIMLGFQAMGVTYIEILVNLVKKLFNWIFDFFDMKVVPNVPDNIDEMVESNKPTVVTAETPKTHWWQSKTNPGSPSGGPGWFHKPMVDSGVSDLLNTSTDSIKDTPHKLTIEINTTPWYQDWYSWLKIGGIILGTGMVILVGVEAVKILSTHWSFDTKGKLPDITTTTPDGTELFPLLK